MAKKLKRAFTLMELVAVLAVLAVLSAILVPSISAVMKRAKIVADEQSVAGANLILNLPSAAAPQNIDGAAALLREGGIELSSLAPKQSGNRFLWDRVSNQIVYADGNYGVVYAAKPFSAEDCELWEAVSSPSEMTAADDRVHYYLVEDYTGDLTADRGLCIASGVVFDGSITLVSDQILSVCGIVTGQISAESGTLTVEYTGEVSKIVACPDGGELSIAVNSLVRETEIAIDERACGTVNVAVNQSAAAVTVNCANAESNRLLLNVVGGQNVRYSSSEQTFCTLTLCVLPDPEAYAPVGVYVNDQKVSDNGSYTASFEVAVGDAVVVTYNKTRTLCTLTAGDRSVEVKVMNATYILYTLSADWESGAAEGDFTVTVTYSAESEN